MKIRSGKHLSPAEYLSATVYIMQDADEEFLSAFELDLPDDQEFFIVEEFEALSEGLALAKYKIDKLVEMLEEEIDNEDEE